MSLIISDMKRNSNLPFVKKCQLTQLRLQNAGREGRTILLRFCEIQTMLALRDIL